MNYNEYYKTICQGMMEGKVIAKNSIISKCYYLQNPTESNVLAISIILCIVVFLTFGIFVKLSKDDN